MTSSKLTTTKPVRIDFLQPQNRLNVYTSRDSPRLEGASGSEWGLKDLFLLVVVKVVVKLVSDSAVQIFPDEPSNVSSLLAFEVPHLPQSACAKDDAL